MEQGLKSSDSSPTPITRRDLSSFSLIPFFIFALAVLVIVVVMFLFISADSDLSNDGIENGIPMNDTSSQSDLRPVATDNGLIDSLGLTTDTSQSVINIDQILSGGPGKDGIPALTDPKFTSINNASDSITDDVRGLVVENNGVVKFYPYTIMVWHEIVNDIVGGKPLTVTFCPLCGSAIVFDPEVNGEVLEFGVSGLLYESNLLMFDRVTETLWSQIEGRAVVGELSKAELEIFPTQVLTFRQVKDAYPEAKILSDETGFNREYDFYPYGDYDEDNEQFLFGTSFNDDRLPSKELMYAVRVDDTPVAFVSEQLIDEGVANLEVNGITLVGNSVDGEITIVRTDTNEPLPGFFAMWFSWSIHNEGGIVWGI